jgi:hypothetical protein
MGPEASPDQTASYLFWLKDNSERVAWGLRREEDVLRVLPAVDPKAIVWPATATGDLGPWAEGVIAACPGRGLAVYDDSFIVPAKDRLIPLRRAFFRAAASRFRVFKHFGGYDIPRMDRDIISDQLRKLFGGDQQPPVDVLPFVGTPRRGQAPGWMPAVLEARALLAATSPPGDGVLDAALAKLDLAWSRALTHFDLPLIERVLTTFEPIVFELDQLAGRLAEPGAADHPALVGRRNDLAQSLRPVLGSLGAYDALSRRLTGETCPSFSNLLELLDRPQQDPSQADTLKDLASQVTDWYKKISEDYTQRLVAAGLLNLPSDDRRAAGP